MDGRDRKSDRATVLLETIKPEILRLLEGSPSHGSIGLDVIFHDGEIARIVSRMEISRLPRTGGAAT
jgi:hypothetical protein